MADVLEFAVFTLMAAASTYIGYRVQDARSILAELLAVLFWVCSAWMWLLNYSASSEAALAWVFAAPIVMCVLRVYEAATEAYRGPSESKRNPFGD